MQGKKEVANVITLLGTAAVIAVLAAGVALMIYNDRREQKMRRF